MVCYLGVERFRELVAQMGVSAIIRGVAASIEADFLRWGEFHKAPRYACHSSGGVIELMPTADSERFACKYVNGHPANAKLGLQTVAAFGILSDVATGYPILIAEMTILTALRTAATSALAAGRLARGDSHTMAIIGLGAQSEFQAIAFRDLVGIQRLRVFDVDPAATAKFLANMSDERMIVEVASDAGEAALGADIITTVTADKVKATILSDNMIGRGVHINAVGGDCPGKTELSPKILERADVFVELAEQTRIEGEIQQMPAAFPVTELWEVFSGSAPGRRSDDQITIFDSVGFAVEDFSALNYIYDLVRTDRDMPTLDLIAAPSDARDLFGLLAPRTSSVSA